MSQHVVFLLLGLANGAVFAGLALALVLTYRSSGVINFATGAVALFSAYFYAFLREGQILIPIPGLPTSIDIGSPLTMPSAIAATLLVDAAVGLIMYATTFRPLRGAPSIAKAVASIGVMVVLTGLVTLRFGTNPMAVGAIFPTNTIEIGSVRVSADRIWFAATILVLTGAVLALFRFTVFGLHTRAAAETETGAYVSGISPDRIAAANWVISAVVAGFVGILISPVSPLVPYSYTLFIVPALAAAIVGGFDRIGVAVAAGLAIGMLQSEMTYLQTTWDWLPDSGMPELVPLVLLLVVLVIRARPLPSRGTLATADLARAPRPERLATSTLIGATLGVVAILATTGAVRAALVTSFIFAIISLSVVVVTGFAGQVSFAQLTLAGVAGFTLSPLTNDWGVPFPIAPILAAAVAMVIGVVVGLPALRVRGLPVAIVTLSLAVTLQTLWFQNSSWVGFTGMKVAPPSLFGLDLGPGTGAAYPTAAFCVMVLTVLVAVSLAVATLRRSSVGSSMLAVRANERAAAAAGINVVATKIAAFAIGAFLAGIGGSLLAYRVGTVTFDLYDVLLGLGLFATVYLAGITSVSGGLLAGLLAAGGIVSYASTQWFSMSTPWYQLATGVALVATVIANPDGLAGRFHAWADARRSADPRGSAGTRTTTTARTSAETRNSTEGTVNFDGAGRLEVAHLVVRYGGIAAVDDVSFTVEPGQIVGLIGPNGAGKTTAIDAISGFVEASGTVHLDGVSIHQLAPFRRIRSGLGRTFQGIELWNELTVAENVLVGPGATRRSDEQVEALFDLLGLGDLKDRPASELSQGQRQLVSIARSLTAGPRVLLLDEPAAGLDSTESEWLAQRLRDIRTAGVSILLVDHDMALVLGLCDRIEVLDQGRIIASGPPEEIRRNRHVAEAYLGAPATSAPAASATMTGKPASRPVEAP